MDNALLSPEAVKQALKTSVELECPPCAWKCSTDTDNMGHKIMIHLTVNRGRHPILVNGYPLQVLD